MPKKRGKANQEQNPDGNNPRPGFPLLQPIRKRLDPALKVRLVDFKQDR